MSVEFEVYRVDFKVRDQESEGLNDEDGRGSRVKSVEGVGGSDLWTPTRT